MSVITFTSRTNKQILHELRNCNFEDRISSPKYAFLLTISHNSVIKDQNGIEYTYNPDPGMLRNTN